MIFKKNFKKDISLKEEDKVCHKHIETVLSIERA